MNEKVDKDNIVELSKASTDAAHSDEEAKPIKNEEEKEYHESIMNDVYNSMTSSDDEEDEEKQKQKLHQEVKQLEEEKKAP
jgi:hypothetical protein